MSNGACQACRTPRSSRRARCRPPGRALPARLDFGERLPIAPFERTPTDASRGHARPRQPRSSARAARSAAALAGRARRRPRPGRACSAQAKPPIAHGRLTVRVARGRGVDEIVRLQRELQPLAAARAVRSAPRCARRTTLARSSSNAALRAPSGRSASASGARSSRAHAASSSARSSGWRAAPRSHSARSRGVIERPHALPCSAAQAGSVKLGSLGSVTS